MDAGGQLALIVDPEPPPGLDRAVRISARAMAIRLRARRRRVSEGLRQAHAERRASQDALPLLFPAPTSTLECRGGPNASEVAAFIAEFSACPVLSCRYNLALWVRDNGSIKVEAGHTKGGTLRHGRRARAAKVERMADLVVELANRLGTLCLWDLLPEGADASGLAEGRPFMSYEAIGQVLGLSKEAARKVVEEAHHGYEIAEAKLSRAEKRAKAAAAGERDQAAEMKRRKLAAGRDQLVQIRPRPVR